MKNLSLKAIFVGMALCLQVVFGQDSSGFRQVASIYNYWGYGTLDVAAAAGFAFVATGRSGIQVLDVGHDDNPVVVGNVEHTPVYDVAVSGGLVYTLNSYNRVYSLHIMTVAADPEIIAIYEVDDELRPWDIIVSEDFAYISTLGGQICIYNVADPEDVSLISILEIPGYPEGLEIAGDILYVAIGRSGMLIIDVSDRENPEIISTFETENPVLDIALSGDIALLALDRVGLGIIDISNPEEPEEITVYADQLIRNITKVISRDENAYVYSRNGVIRVDFSDPEEPTRSGYILYPVRRLTGLAFSGDWLIASKGESGYPLGLSRVDISDPEEPGPTEAFEMVGVAGRLVIDGNTAFTTESGPWY